MKIQTIGIDVDGCIANFNFRAQQLLKDRLGIVIPSANVSKYSKEVHDLIVKDHQELYSSLLPEPFSVDVLNTWHSAKKSLYYITHRATEPDIPLNDKEAVASETTTWLSALGFPPCHLFCVSDKLAWAKKSGIDLMIEDKAKTAEEFAAAGISVLFICHSYNRRPKESDKIFLMDSWEEIQWLVEQMEKDEKIDQGTMLWG